MKYTDIKIYYFHMAYHNKSNGFKLCYSSYHSTSIYPVVQVQSI